MRLRLNQTENEVFENQYLLQQIKNRAETLNGESRGNKISGGSTSGIKARIRPFKTRRSQSNSSARHQRASCGIEFNTNEDKSPDSNSKKSSKRSRSQEPSKSGDYLDSLMDKMISKSLLIINESSNTDNDKFPI